jgi:hypothetical protein
VRINNNLLLWSSVSDPPRDRVDSFSSTLRRRRDMGELNGWAGVAFLGMASLRREAKDHNKDERPRELLRRMAYRSARSAWRVLTSGNFRHHDFLAEDIAVLFCKQPVEVL